MAYTKTVWVDRVVQYPNRYKDQNLVQYTFSKDNGTVTEAGTAVNAINLNKMETGIEDAHTAIGLKAPLADPTFTGTVVLPSTTSIGTVSATELGYLDGVTSAIQTQINGKLSLTAMPTFENITVDGQYVGEYSTEAMAVTCALYDLLYLSSSGYNKAKADADSTLPTVGLCVETGTGNRKVLKKGYVRNDAWNWTVGQLLYVSTGTAGLITSTKPSTAGNRIQIIGYAVSADIIYFNPDYTWIEV